MCAEFVKEINYLIDQNKESNALRFSYIISLQVDLQASLINNYSSCIESEVA